MFGLFGKKEGKTMEEQLAKCQKKQDWVGLARTYYDLGVAAMDGGALDEATLWLHRADTIYSAKDEVFEQASRKRLFRPEIVDNCSDRIGALEDEPLLYNTVPAEIEEKAEQLDDAQVRAWGLLSIARLVKLGERLGKLPGCEVLLQLGWAVDRMLQSFQNAPSQEDYQRLMDICNGLYELGDSEAFYAGGEIDVPGKESFQVFDLNGMGILLELNGYLDGHLRLISALSRGAEDLPAAESGVVGCALLPDYYVRTWRCKPGDVPQVNAELQRIWSDYDFVRSDLTWEKAGQKIAGYKQLDILA